MSLLLSTCEWMSKPVSYKPLHSSSGCCCWSYELSPELYLETSWRRRSQFTKREKNSRSSPKMLCWQAADRGGGRRKLTQKPPRRDWYSATHAGLLTRVKIFLNMISVWEKIGNYMGKCGRNLRLMSSHRQQWKMVTIDDHIWFELSECVTACQPNLFKISY